MKLTKERLIEIIKEEMYFQEEDSLTPDENTAIPPVPTEPETKVDSGVESIIKLMPKINNYQRFQQLVDAVLAHDFKDPTNKLRILKITRDKINVMLKGDGSPED